MRLIDGDKLKADIESFFADEIHIYDSFVELIDEQPTIEPERKTGKWIERWHENKHVIGDMACSVCGAQMLLTYPRFCPYCGAEMRGEQ